MHLQTVKIRCFKCKYVFFIWLVQESSTTLLKNEHSVEFCEGKDVITFYIRHNKVFKKCGW